LPFLKGTQNVAASLEKLKSAQARNILDLFDLAFPWAMAHGRKLFRDMMFRCGGAQLNPGQKVGQKMTL